MSQSGRFTAMRVFSGRNAHSWCELSTPNSGKGSGLLITYQQKEGKIILALITLVLGFFLSLY